MWWYLTRVYRWWRKTNYGQEVALIVVASTHGTYVGAWVRNKSGLMQVIAMDGNKLVVAWPAEIDLDRD